MAQTVADIMTRLPAQFGIVLDEAGLPVRVEERGRGFPAHTVAPDLPVVALRADPKLERLLSQGLPGLLVLEGDTLVGVLSAHDLIELGRPRTSRSYRGGDSQDTVLDSEARPMSCRVLVRCRICGRTNSFDYFLPTVSASCEGGHPLDPDMS